MPRTRHAHAGVGCRRAKFGLSPGPAERRPARAPAPAPGRRISISLSSLASRLSRVAVECPLSPSRKPDRASSQHRAPLTAKCESKLCALHRATGGSPRLSPSARRPERQCDAQISTQEPGQDTHANTNSATHHTHTHTQPPRGIGRLWVLSTCSGTIGRRVRCWFALFSGLLVSRCY